MLVTIDKITKKFYEQVIFDEASYVIHDHDKIGIIGVNGTGKSTLLKMIAQLESIDSGKIQTKKGIKISYLAQAQNFDPNKTINEVAVKEMIHTNPHLNQYEIIAMLSKLGITDLDAKIDSLSGGQKKRIALALTLLEKSDLLILDEPTNHLDHEMIIWLEEYLQKFTGALLMVTHDRFFLDRVTTRILEINQTKIYNHETNYSGYLTRKLEREQMELASERKRNTLIKKEQEWMNQGIKARGTRSKKRVEKFQELLNTPKIQTKEQLQLDSFVSRLGNKTIELEAVSKAYGEQQIINNFSYQFQKYDRIGIVGNNGTGKSTLLNMITQKIKPTSGTVEIGETIKIGYYCQEPVTLDNNQKIIDFISEIATEITMPSGRMSASQLLETFLFDRKKQYQYIEHLSGGEKRRLYLLTILITAPNVLVLDEPTNDLDIETLTILEDFLDDYPGIIITVSHDRYFLNRVVDKIFEIDEKANVNIYNEGYGEYFSEKTNKVETKKEQTKPEKIHNKGNNKTLKFTYKEQQEFATIDQDISELETKISEIDTEIMKVGSDFTKLNELTSKRAELEENLLEKTERWFYLQDLNEKINNKG